MTDKGELETERDFLLRSLDDLELEHESGGIDDESYAELHDDYTARAAATIRALRDGVDARPAPATPVPAKRRMAIIAAVVVFAIVAGVALAAALGARLPGQTASGNQTESAAATRKQLKAEIIRLQNEVNASPDDYDLRLELAEAYARNDDLPTALRQWDAAITIDPTRPEAQASLGRALYIVSQQLSDKNEQAQTIAKALAAFDSAITHAPDYADSYFFRGVVRAGIGQYAASQADLQRYLSKAPEGQWGANARDLLARVTKALEAPSTTVVTPSTTK